MVETPKDRLDQIFDNQDSLTAMYLPIEVSNSLRWTDERPVQINSREGQAQLKDYFWRFTEEMTEAGQALNENGGHDANEKVVEELIDALHFLVEIARLSDMSSKDMLWTDAVPEPPEAVGVCKMDILYNESQVSPIAFLGLYQVIHFIGTASNMLKARAWKQTYPDVSIKDYRLNIRCAMMFLLGIFKGFNVTPDKILAEYTAKTTKCLERIETRY